MSQSPHDPDSAVDQEQGFLSHLFELRDRLLRMVVAVLVMFLALFPFNNDIYTWLAGPLMQHLPEGNSMIATEVAAPFLVPFKMTLMLAIFLAVPVILYQMWAFIAPGLYLREKQLVKPLLISSTLLFYLGVGFAYYVVFPLIFAFFTSVTPEGVAMMTDIGKYLDFIITIFFAFGIAFEVPIATILLVAVGMTTPDSLAEKRPYIIVAAFVIGMLLTPPDVISQTLLALPMWFLFEMGVLFSRLLVKRRAEQAAADEAAEVKQNQSTAALTTGSVAAGASAATHSEDLSVRPPPVPSHEIIEYEPLTDEEMEAELDRIEAEEVQHTVDAKPTDHPSRYDAAAAEREANMEDLEEAYSKERGKESYDAAHHDPFATESDKDKPDDK